MTTTISGSNGIVFPDATSMQTGQQAVKVWVDVQQEPLAKQTLQQLQ